MDAFREIPPGGAVAAAETPAEGADDAVEPEPEPEIEPAEAEETPDESEQPAAAEAPKSVAELAKALEIDESDLLALTVQGPDGAPVPLSTVVEGWRAAPAAARLTSELTQKAQEIDTFRAGLEAEHRAVVDRAVALIGAMTQDFEAGYAGVNWNQLKDEDPQRYLMLRQERVEREQRLRGATDQLRSDWQRADGQRQQARLARLDVEAKKLASAVPGWHDPSKATEEMQALRGFLHKTYGLTDADLNVIEDHRFILAALDAMKYRNAAASAPKLLEKLKGLPRPVMKAKAAPEAPSDAALTQRKRAAVLARLRKTGSDADAAAAFKALGP